MEQPLVGLNLHIYRDQAVLSLDSSGESLHKRGYRPILTRAPLNEALAAGLVRLTGWRGETPLVDPMCGSGTLPIEACLDRFAPAAGPDPPPLRLPGLDGFRRSPLGGAARRSPARHGQAPARADPWLRMSGAMPSAFREDNARAAGVGHLLHFEVKDLADFRPPEGPPGVLICNPPYGERIGEEKELRATYRTLGDVLRRYCGGWARSFSPATRHWPGRSGCRRPSKFICSMAGFRVASCASICRPVEQQADLFFLRFFSAPGGVAVQTVESLRAIPAEVLFAVPRFLRVFRQLPFEVAAPVLAAIAFDVAFQPAELAFIRIGGHACDRRE